MLTAKVVFVLGAGASEPYGFPTGATLFRDILLTLKRKPPNVIGQITGAEPPGPRHWLLEAGFDSDDIERFRSTLADPGHMSVDAFLEHRPEFQEVGKAAMAANLMPCETHDVLFDVDAGKGEHWYRYLFGKLSTKFDELEKSDVAFITFNYDRSLEYFLTKAIQNAYGKSFLDAKAKLEHFHIVHVYGDLGELTENDAHIWRVGAAITPQRLKAAAARIKIIHDEQGRDQFSAAQHFLYRADVVCFLGFGFHPTNMLRLFDGLVIPSDRRALASAYGLLRAEQNGVSLSIQKYLPVNAIGDPEHKVLNFLRQHFIWW